MATTSLSAFTVNENAADDTVVAIISSDGAGAPFVLTNDAGGRFHIVNNGGTYELRVNNGLLIDYENDSDHEYTIRITDNESAFQDFDIAIIDVDPETVTGDGNANEILGGLNSGAGDTLSGAGGDDTLEGGDGDDSLSGGADNDSILGGDGNDTLDGGAGVDTMRGGDGDDSYVVDNELDVISESSFSGSGTDQVRFTGTGFTYSLDSNVENLLIDEVAGAANVEGNNDANIIQGNSFANSIDGRGGADEMEGGDGNDTYYVDNAGDIVTEAVNEGTDTVVSSITFDMSTVAHVEHLTLTGAFDRNATGNDHSNLITGNDGSNIINGGDAGDDTLVGGRGSDTYVLDSGRVGTVTITEESQGGSHDEIQVDAGDFANAFSLAGIDFVEHLTHTGANGATLTGNAERNAITGNAGADSIDGGADRDTMVGGDGDDTYVVDNTSDVVTENAAEGTDLVRSSVTHTLGANVENLVLTGTDEIDGTGNAEDNEIDGNAAANEIDGGAGADSMAGGDGDDTYIVDDAGDVVLELLNEGTDTVESSITFTLGSDVENLTLTGDETNHINGTGNDLNNVITGNAGDNIIDGDVNTAGGDTLAGGQGDDTYVIRNADDVINEASGTNGGTDEVRSTVASYTLGSRVENLVLLAGFAAVNGTGNTLDNVITGNAANNLIDGGSGADTMAGGNGDDTFVVDNANDVVDGGADTDLIQASASVDLNNHVDVENVTLTGTGSIDATGDGFENVLTGNSNANLLDGGAGDDTLVGGSGNDTYVVDSLLDVVTENVDDGEDEVQTALASYSLAANVENRTLTGAGQSVIGNELDNDITGSAGSDLIDGGAGDDTMRGGAGDDTYLVDSTSDDVREEAGEGTDEVQSTVDYELGENIENLVLASGAGDINGTGNASGNEITGNEGANEIDGGAGDDTMAGGDGDDTYIVDSVGDVVTENLAEGAADLVRSSAISLDIADFANVENLTVTGSADLNLTGDANANVLTGNSGKNLITGNGGADTLVGGTDDDTYILTDGTEVIEEAGIELAPLVRTEFPLG